MVRVRHKSGSEEIIRAERKMADTWARLGRGEGWSGAVGAALPRVERARICHDKRAKHLITNESEGQALAARQITVLLGFIIA